MGWPLKAGDREGYESDEQADNGGVKEDRMGWLLSRRRWDGELGQGIKNNIPDVQ